ncbi:MAG: aminodeoxychorismate synthase component I [Pyrinomonadaceae bacterium]
MATAIFGSSTQGGGGWSLSFESPLRIYSAQRVDEVLPLLKTVEAEAQAGAWVALMISYEAAPAFDKALKTHAAASFPLAWAAVFDKPSANKPGHSPGTYLLSEWKPQVARSSYNEAVNRIRELIARGDTYQVNYTFPLTSVFEGDALACYRDLCMAQGAQFCAYFDLGSYKILSLSPELFFERNGDSIRTKPMKGTIRRGRWAAEDFEMRETLADSEKDRAENVMIVDLIRNDLGKVSVPGTVCVTSLFELERFETLWQMTSTVESTLRPNVSFAELMCALFPCGSITGAPKVRTTEIIRELEPLPRNIYTGTLGFLRPGGDAVFNVAIRTLLLDCATGRATFGVGGGITYDSTPEREYEECLVKSSFLASHPPSFSLLESILLDCGDYFLLSKHLARLASSANYFGFLFEEEKVLSELERVAAHHPSGKWKIRLLLSKNGEVETEAFRLEHESDRTLRVALSPQPVNSSDRFLFHKTTNRSLYNNELKARTDCDDVVFWNERGELTESSIANIVLNLDGQLWTPTHSSGLLAGTFREELLDAGKIRERVIRVEEIRHASSFFLINSVRKWMPAVFVD